MILLNLVMLLGPPLLGWWLYINKLHLTVKRSILQFLGYFFVINLSSYVVSYIRGVKRLVFDDMTVSYRVKFFCMGCVFAIVLQSLIFIFKRNMYIFKHLKVDILAFKRDMKKYFRYSVRLAKADLRTEVANSYLDWLWWLIEPFCTMLIYVFIYGFVFQVKEEYFTAFIYIGLTIWSFFQRNVMTGVNIVRSSKPIISKIYIPKYILLFSKMLVNGFKMLISFGIVIIMMGVYRVHITINVLMVIPIMIELFLITFALGVVLMHYGVFVRDLSYITEIVLRMMVYMTGTFYAVAKRIPAPYGEILEKFNPIAYLIAAMRDVLLYGKSISYQALFGWAIFALIILLFGIATVYRNENSYVKVI